jgi:hypothetical protein
LRSPYREIGSPIMRVTVAVVRPDGTTQEIVLDVDDVSIDVRHPDGGFVVSAIDQLFVVERPPPAHRFLTWFGVFARRRGFFDRVLVETPESHVARFVERTIERRLGLGDERVRGELRL